MLLDSHRTNRPRITQRLTRHAMNRTRISKSSQNYPKLSQRHGVYGTAVPDPAGDYPSRKYLFSFI